MAEQRFYQGEYIPENASKFPMGNPIYRSMLERRFMYYLDIRPNITELLYESLHISYFCEVHQKWRTYITDFMFKANTRKGPKIYLAEVKPKDQVPMEDENGDFIPPEKPKKKTKKALKNWEWSFNTLLNNYCKFKAAKNYCKENNMTFVIVTEKELYNYIK